MLMIFIDFRNMLSSAHILAMDTKNLLDVCDSIRARFPNVRYELPEASASTSLPLTLAQQLQHKQSPIQQEVYENVSNTIGAVEQIYCNQTLPSEVGIYDNQAAIQEQLKIVEEPTTPTNVESQFNSQILSN